TFPIRSRSGEYRWFLARMLPGRNADGKVVRWIGTHTDVTESFEAASRREQHLQREREARSEAENRAREEEALRAAVAVVVASSSTGEIFQKVAESAVTATGADAALIER